MKAELTVRFETGQVVTMQLSTREIQGLAGWCFEEEVSAQVRKDYAADQKIEQFRQQLERSI